MEEFPTGTLLIGHTTTVNHIVVSRTVGARSIIGEEPIARDIHFHTFIIGSIQPITIFTLNDIIFRSTISINSSQEVIVACMTQTVLLVNQTLIDQSETFSEQEHLELVASVLCQVGVNESSTVQDYLGNHSAVSCVDVDSVCSRSDFLDGRGNAGIIDQDVGESAFFASS